MVEAENTHGRQRVGKKIACNGKAAVVEYAKEHCSPNITHQRYQPLQIRVLLEISHRLVNER